MERRVLIAILLSFVVLYAFQAFVVKPAPKSSAQTASTTMQGGRTAPAPGAMKPAATAAAAPPAPTAAALVGDTTERDVRVETHDVVALITNRGARLKSWRLKKYLDQERKPQELVENQLPTTTTAVHDRDVRSAAR